jgi:hypothetical protein
MDTNSKDVCNGPSLSQPPPRGEARDRFFPAKKPLPIALSLHFDMPTEDDSPSGRKRLNPDILLIRADDPNFACCWLSRPFDSGADRDNPGFWMLQKTARDTWQLRLRRFSGDEAVYHAKTRKHGFPITLKGRRVAKRLAKWPGTVTVRWAQ